jgi:hypothetical protein
MREDDGEGNFSVHNPSSGSEESVEAWRDSKEETRASDQSHSTQDQEDRRKTACAVGREDLECGR